MPAPFETRPRKPVLSSLRRAKRAARGHESIAHAATRPLVPPTLRWGLPRGVFFA